MDEQIFHVFFISVGDLPERILQTSINLSDPDWDKWNAYEVPQEILKPELDWEEALLPKSKSLQGEISFPVNQLRDPYIFNDELTKNNYLLYSVAGEQAVGIVLIKTN